jgi:SAM-dependent methyltransferase
MQKELLKDIVQWDVKTWSKAIDYWDATINWDKVQTCLEIGAREGGLSLWLSLKGKNVVCSDMSSSKDKAEILHQKYKAATTIEYKDIDATQIPYQNYFDVIVFKSVIGGIGRNNNYQLLEQVMREVHKALKPGGKLLFAENSTASAMHRFIRKRNTRWGDYWRYISLDETKALLKPFSSFTIKTTGFLGTFGRTEAQRNLLSSADEVLFNKICPDKWKYVLYGVAEK